MPPKRKTRHNSPQTPTRHAPWLTPHPSLPEEVTLHLGPARTPIFINPSIFPRSSILRTRPTDLEQCTLPEASFLLYYLHFHELPEHTPGDDKALALLVKAWFKPDDLGSTKTRNLIRLYALCETLDIDALRRECLDELFWHQRSSGEVKLPGAEDICFAYGQLGEGDALCRFLVDVHWHDACHRHWCCVDLGGLPREFLRDVLVNYGLIREGRLDADKVMDVCDYHEHENEGEREECARELAEGT